MTPIKFFEVNVQKSSESEKEAAKENNTVEFTPAPEEKAKALDQLMKEVDLQKLQPAPSPTWVPSN
jgi:hypothetical protein